MTSNRLDHDALSDALGAAGLRSTPQRLAVYDQLAAMDGHPTAEQVFLAVRPRLPRISLATVYKALEALTAVGAVDRLTPETAGGSARYDARGDRHYHFRCLRTGSIHDLPMQYDPSLLERLDPALAEDLRSRGFHVTDYRLELLGYRLLPGRGPGRDGGAES